MARPCVLVLLALSLVAACATTGTPPQSQLQIREFQTRSYETTDTKMVMKAVLNTLQDEGYIVKNAVPDLGLLTATKEVDVEDKTTAVLLSVLSKGKATWPKNSIIEATANVSEFGTQTRVRLNFQVKTYDNKGAVREVKQVEDGKFYQDFFSKVDKGIFIQKENL
jgi:ribosomal protein S8